MRHVGAELPSNPTSTLRPLVLLEKTLQAIIAAMLAFGLHRAFIANINWDEFYFLSQLHLYQNGTLTAPLQTIHVHLFGWLPLISDNEIQQIFAARSFVWLISLGTSWLIYDVARKFCSKEAALFPVLFYLGFSYVMDHGLSFRTDPLCAFLFLASLRCLLGADRSRVQMAISAFFLAAAIMISIKSVFYLATIGPILLTYALIEPVKPGAKFQVLVFIVAFTLMVFLLYQFHSMSIASVTAREAGGAMMSAGNKVLLSGPLFPRAHYIIRGILENPFIWIFVLLGLAKASYDALKRNNRQGALVLVSFALPLLSLIFYRNAFPYFFVFLMPGVVILGGSFGDVLIRHFRNSHATMLIAFPGAITLLIAAGFVMDYNRKLPDQTIAQSEIVAEVHRMFSAPVPYIDRNSMIASFPKVGFFMSGWGMENYRARNKPVMENLIRLKQPRLLIVNHCALNISPIPKHNRRFCGHRLLDQDFNTLRTNFVHHWGAIYVAGKHFDLQHLAAPQSFETLVFGTYSLEADAAVTINGVEYQPGAQIQLDQAVYTIAAADKTTRATLRLGPNKPSLAPSTQGIYDNF